MLPDRIRQSSKITLGSISLEIDRLARERGDEQLLGAVSGLSADALDELLQMPRSGSRMIVGTGPGSGDYTVHANLDALYELRDRGLIESPSHYSNLETIESFSFEVKNDGKLRLHAELSNAEGSRLTNIGVKLTDLGVEAVRIVLEYVRSKWI